MYVFSYGTLKHKYPGNYSVEAILEDYFIIDTTDWFPILRKSESLNSISGFLIEVTPEEFKEIDIYEGYPELYNRVKRTINGTEAWVYIEPN